MLHIGCHLSSSKGFLAMGRQALELGADTFQFFTRNPRGSKAKELDPADVAALAALMKEHCFAPIIAHAPYTLNLCGAEEQNRLFARDTMADDLRRMEPVSYTHLPFSGGSRPLVQWADRNQPLSPAPVPGGDRGPVLAGQLPVPGAQRSGEPARDAASRLVQGVEPDL